MSENAVPVSHRLGTSAPKPGTRADPERRLEADVVGARVVELFENVLSKGRTQG